MIRSLKVQAVQANEGTRQLTVVDFGWVFFGVGLERGQLRDCLAVSELGSL